MSEAQLTDLLEELYQKYYRVVYNHCLLMIRHQNRYVHLVDDCVQEAFVTLIHSYPKLTGHPNHVGWLCNAAWNRMRSAIRRTKKDDRKLEKLKHSLKADAAHTESAFDRWINKEESLFQLEKIYQTLTGIERKVYDSYFVDELSLNETAEENDISRNSVRSAIDRIRKRARRG